MNLKLTSLTWFAPYAIEEGGLDIEDMAEAQRYKRRINTPQDVLENRLWACIRMFPKRITQDIDTRDSAVVGGNLANPQAVGDTTLWRRYS